MRNLLMGTYSFLCLLGISLLTFFIPRYTPEYMGYGLPSSAMPNLLAGCIVVFSFIELIKTYRNKEDKRPSTINSKNLLHLIKITGVAFLTFPLMDLVTFIPGAILSILAFQWLCGQRNYILMAIISVILSVTIYYIGTYVLLISLP